ncbi:organic cation/carnitine transporter 7 [Phtheirospermum japonicum]|uniref:Organic cation/carnitine transporter 7 n=1 Tax=Phtheirospermum japonicum TaxID=374723 RepID=A0A830D0V9_9LAMI|nr:organic cation/carnitine transporter 7 [Phtheirospermum japonicum]
MAESMELMILSFIGPSVKDEWGLSSGQESLITTVVFLGMLVGSYLWAFISDNQGRRIGLVSVAVVTSIFAFVSALAPNYILLVVCRMIVGIGLGGGPVYAAWYIEFVPVQNRGVCMVIYSTFWTIGSILEALLAWIVMPIMGWRWLLAFSSLPCFALFIFYFLTIESPRYLCLKGKIGDAHNVLKKVAEINKTELPPGSLVYHQISENTPLLSATNPKPGSSSFFTLLSPSLLRTSLLMWVVFFGNAFVYFGVILMIPELTSVKRKCGAVVLNPNTLANSILYKNVFISSFAEVPGLILSAALVDKFGRRISMMILYLIGFLCFLPLIFDQYELIKTTLFFGVRMCITGNYKLATIYCPEVIILLLFSTFDLFFILFSPPN